MPLSIRNPKAEKLARELIAITGENMTEAIIQALEERIATVKRSSTNRYLAEDLLRIGKSCADLPVVDDTTSEDDILGYSNSGILE